MDAMIKLQEIFRDVFDDEELVITPEMTADDIEEWDSLTHIQLIVAVESTFNLKFSTVKVQRLKNVSDLIDLIEESL